MAVTRGATTNKETRSINGTDADISHAVDSGTTLLIASVFFEADESVTGTVQWSLGGGENMTLIDATTSSGSFGDVAMATYGLVNPTSGAGTVTIPVTFNDNSFSNAINYIGTETASVAAATNFLEEHVNNVGTDTTTTIFASAGTSGNALYAAAVFFGGDGDPSSNNASFTELFDEATGPGSSSDTSVNICDLLDSAPSAVTITWADEDQNAGHYIEIVAAAAGANPKGPFGMPLHGPFGGPIGIAGLGLGMLRSSGGILVPNNKKFFIPKLRLAA